MKSTENIITTPHIAPIKAAPAGDTASHPAVIPTSPAKIDVYKRQTLFWLYTIE